MTKSYIAIHSSSIAFFTRTPHVPKTKYMVTPAEVLINRPLELKGRKKSFGLRLTLYSL